MPDPRPLVAMDRVSGSVIDSYLSGCFSNCFLICAGSRGRSSRTSKRSSHRSPLDWSGLRFQSDRDIIARFPRSAADVCRSCLRC